MTSRRRGSPDEARWLPGEARWLLGLEDGVPAFCVIHLLRDHAKTMALEGGPSSGNPHMTHHEHIHDLFGNFSFPSDTVSPSPSHLFNHRKVAHILSHHTRHLPMNLAWPPQPPAKAHTPRDQPRQSRRRHKVPVGICSRSSDPNLGTLPPSTYHHDMPCTRLILLSRGHPPMSRCLSPEPPADTAGLAIVPADSDGLTNPSRTPMVSTESPRTPLVSTESPRTPLVSPESPRTPLVLPVPLAN
ncbi:hypothetical protein ACLB2K_019979 [Fragaria x ananassa]